MEVSLFFCRYHYMKVALNFTGDSFECLGVLYHSLCILLNNVSDSAGNYSAMACYCEYAIVQQSGYVGEASGL